LTFKGRKTNAVLEQEMFSILNRLIKRDFYTDTENKRLQLDLQNDCVEYLQDFNKREVH